MGYANPIQRINGYTPSADVIYTDPTVYTNDQNSWVSKITGEVIESLAAKSTLRFSADLKSSGVGIQYEAGLRMLFNGVVVWSETDSDAVYTTYSTDIDMTNYTRGTIIDVQISSKSVGVDTTSLTNFTISATKTPILIN